MPISGELLHHLEGRNTSGEVIANLLEFTHGGLPATGNNVPAKDEGLFVSVDFIWRLDYIFT